MGDEQHIEGETAPPTSQFVRFIFFISTYKLILVLHVSFVLAILLLSFVFLCSVFLK